jgi:membrane protease YdiL (CAAX protease family)
MRILSLRAIGQAFGLFLIVYVPAFAAVSLARPPIQVAVPLVIGISLAIALALTFALARRASGIREFGFRVPKLSFVGWAVMLGLPLSIGADWLVHRLPSKSPIDLSGLPFWMLGLYFVICASIQEEIIFRGLLQSFLEQRWTAANSVLGVALSPAVLFAATLFAIVHLESGVAVFVGAMVLGLVAGELRRRGGSLLPAVIVHAVFNAANLVWP